ncbi:MAG: hypothetical protein ACI9AT_001023 [Ulvibacter sp.]|jgi:hypothetical protein
MKGSNQRHRVNPNILRVFLSFSNYMTFKRTHYLMVRLILNKSKMKTASIFLLLMASFQLFSQSSDTTFFPQFESYEPSPIIDWNDFIVGSWADPTVLKVDNEYIMYVSAMHGGISTPEPLSIYRFSSIDGYSWEMNPTTPVFEPLDGTFFEGGIETPNVVFFNGGYHMYNTVYLENIPSLFKVSHATSSDGIEWIMDDIPSLVPDPTVDWMSEIVAEPGAVVKNDTLHLFFTGISSSGEVSIGLARSLDGSSFLDTTQVVTLPTDVYPVSEGYLGLSTPDATLVGDTIYLFTDLVRTDTHTPWNQVGLHQFKSYDNINQWYHDTTAVHMSDEFTWTDGNYLSQLLGAAPMMDGNKLRIWYWGYDLAEIGPIDTTYHVHLEGTDLHPNIGHWGIGTSEYLFTSVTGISDPDEINSNISIEFNNGNGFIRTYTTEQSVMHVYAANGQLLYHNTFRNTLNFNIDYNGLILINVTNGKSVATKKCFSLK